MNCEKVKRDELVERYHLDQLDESLREEFELHYFTCPRCFDELRLLQGLRSELPAVATTAQGSRVEIVHRWRWAWAGALASVFLLASVGVWLRRAPNPSQVSPIQSSAKPPEALSNRQAPESRQLTLADLASIEPPTYTATTLRSTSDEASLRFRKAMEYYEKQEYGRAASGLLLAKRADSQRPDIHFYLGACYLLTGQTKRSTEEFERTVEFGNSPYLQDARFYLAKAYLRQGEVAASRDELRKLIQLHGEREPQAVKLLQQIDAVVKGQP
jgi:tetratricopeptide (TPR) repeat protein